MSKLRDTVMQRRAELLEELAECDAFLGIGYGQPILDQALQPITVKPAERTDEVKPSHQPPHIPATTIIPQRTHGSSAKPPDDEAEQAVARNNNLAKMLDGGLNPLRIATRPIVDENGKPTGGVERVPT